MFEAASALAERRRRSDDGFGLPESFDLMPAPGASQAWFTWMAIIPAFVDSFETQRFLRPGINEITISRGSDDNFEVNDVVVHWRE